MKFESDRLESDGLPRPLPALAARRRLALAALGSLGVTATMGRVQAQTGPWPNRPVTIISPYNPGGTNDVPARIYAEGFERLLGQRFIVRNQPGAAAILGSRTVMSAPADGYTLLSTNIGGMAVQSAARNPSPYHPLRHFTPIVKLVDSVNFVGVNAELPVNNVTELIALAKRQPGKLNFSSAGVGSYGHLMGELFKMLTETDIVHVPGKGSADAVLEMKAGRIQLMFDPIVLPQSSDGRIKVLAVFSEQRMSQHPNLPTLREAGAPDMPLDAWFGLFGPAGLPDEVVTRLESAARAIAAEPDVRSKFQNLGLSPVMAGASEFRTRIEGSMKWIGETVARAKISLE
jgi:tripartite-type tricarboxylate transporter receptor subunit TctC